jgi:hypothetical protein
LKKQVNEKATLLCWPLKDSQINDALYLPTLFQ